MADPPSPYDGFMTMSLDDRFALLFRAQQVRFDADKKVDDQLSAIESKLERLTASLPKPPAAPTPSARAPRARRTSRKERPAAPTSTPTTGPPHSQSIRSTTTKAALEKIVATLSIADEQAGHVIGRAGTGLRQIHDISHAKISVSPVVTSGLRAVTIRGTAREVGDALSAIGKRIARRRIRNPRSKKPKQPPAPTAAPPTLVVEPPSPTPTSSSTPTTRTSRSGTASPHSPTPTAVDTRSSPSSSLAPGSPMEVDALRAPQQHSDGYSRPGPVQPREGIQTARRGGGPPRVFGANRPR
ncbi:hypothetical protein JR316_0011240 [Psilocybe cubensis]|uniref:Uncharacterized protein n=2 Tax=Psilocybe cubensis TaxID=181762 RepID=A0ACB8GJH4_PSICU|nr:hypothetical protein JR316_0011240 [Psilocybe cubensis]KAH9475681.1 hypothetical protein JR316_0011240 [Psilocybe cubensis]